MEQHQFGLREWADLCERKDATIAALQKEIATRDSTDSILATRIRELEARLTQRTEQVAALQARVQELVKFYDQHNGTPCEQIRHQQEIAQLRESRQCAETYMLILADKLQFSSSQFPQLSSGWCEELVNTITALQSQLAVAQAQVLEAQDGVNALLEASSDRCRKHEQQVAQLRENVSKIECELSEWKLASAANETGHLFRCARVNGKWSCAKGCHAAAHTTLQGLVEQANYELAALFPVPDRPTFENAFTVCGNKNTADARCILNAYEAIHEAATLPREGGAQEEPTKKCLPNCPYCNDPFYGHKGHR